MLPVGLHSYGRMDSAYAWLIGFVLAQVLLIATALLPWRFWRSEFGQSKDRKERKPISGAREGAGT